MVTTVKLQSALGSADNFAAGKHLKLHWKQPCLVVGKIGVGKGGVLQAAALVTCLFFVFVLPSREERKWVT